MIQRTPHVWCDKGLIAVVDLKTYGIMVTESEIVRRYGQIEPYESKRAQHVLLDVVGYCIDRAKDAYILGMPEVCSFLSGKSLEEALSFEFDRRNHGKKLPDFCKLIEWGRKCGILDTDSARIAHQVRRIRNDYGHAYLKVMRRRRQKGKAPFTDAEALKTFAMAVNVLTFMYP